jgi:hypothetical protein
MKIGRKARHLACVGKSGTGKTTLGLRYLFNSHHGRVIVADHEGEFALRLNIPLCQSWSEFYASLEKNRVTCLDITELDEEGAVAAFDKMCGEVLDLCKTTFEPANLETLVVIDEVQKYASPHAIPGNFKACLETGRKYALDTFSLSQRPNRINGDMKEQFTEMFFFRMTEPNSHDFGEYYGIEPAEQMALADGQFIYLDLQRGERRTDRIF